MSDVKGEHQKEERVTQQILIEFRVEPVEKEDSRNREADVIKEQGPTTLKRIKYEKT